MDLIRPLGSPPIVLQHCDGQAADQRATSCFLKTTEGYINKEMNTQITGVRWHTPKISWFSINRRYTEFHLFANQRVWINFLYQHALVVAPAGTYMKVHWSHCSACTQRVLFIWSLFHNLNGKKKKKKSLDFLPDTRTHWKPYNEPLCSFTDKRSKVSLFCFPVLSSIYKRSWKHYRASG